MFDHKMVVRFSGGETMSCFGDSFIPGEKEMLVKDLNENIHNIALDSVKMVCFVRHFVTDSQNTHRRPGKMLFQGVPGRKVKIVFRDGEVFEGITSLRERPRIGFFLTPLNPNSNNVNIYANPAEIESFKFLD